MLFKVWARTEDAALSPDGVWQGEANSPDCTKHSKSGVFAEPTSPEWREVVSGPKPKNFHKAKHAASPVYNRFQALQDEPAQEFVSVLRQACVDGMASHEAKLIQVVEKPSEPEAEQATEPAPSEGSPLAPAEHLEWDGPPKKRLLW